MSIWVKWLEILWPRPETPRAEQITGLIRNVSGTASWHCSFRKEICP